MDPGFQRGQLQGLAVGAAAIGTAVGGQALLGALYGGAETVAAAEGAEAIADEALVGHMNGLNICSGTDCSEIAESIQGAANGSGSILHITPAAGSELSLSEYGTVQNGFTYHDVFTDGSFAYDPRFSPSAVPLPEYLNGVQTLNPGATIVPR